MFVSIDGGKSWNKMKNNMPTQPVHDLKIHPRENDIIVATHGRGIYILDISPLVELTQDVLAKDVHLFNVESKVRWINNKMNESSSSNFNGQSEPIGIPIYYYLKQKSQGDVKIKVYNGNMLINEIEGETEPGLHKAVWMMDQRRERTEEEKKEARQRMERMRRFSGRGFGRRMDPDYIFFPASFGKYRIVLAVDGREFITYASIIQDLWYDK
jgi:hypothetical protein